MVKTLNKDVKGRGGKRDDRKQINVVERRSASNTEL